MRIVEILVDEASGAVPVLAGAGGYDTREVIHLAGEMQKAGAAGLLSVTPYYNKPTQEGLYQHYRAIAESTPLPIIVYNVPGRTGVNVEPATLARLAAIPNIVGVKEASGNITQMCEVCQRVPAGLHRAVGRRCAHAAADGDRRTRRHLGGVERDSRPRWCRWSKRPSAATSRRRAPSTHRILPLMQVNFVEAEPGAGEGGDGGDGTARRGLPAADVLAAGPSRKRRSSRSSRSARDRRSQALGDRPLRQPMLRLTTDISKRIAQLVARAPPPIATPCAPRSRSCARRCPPARVRAAEPDASSPSAGGSTPG